MNYLELKLAAQLTLPKAPEKFTVMKPRPEVVAYKQELYWQWFKRINVKV